MSALPAVCVHEDMLATTQLKSITERSWLEHLFVVYRWRQGYASALCQLVRCLMSFHYGIAFTWIHDWPVEKDCRSPCSHVDACGIKGLMCWVCFAVTAKSRGVFKLGADVQVGLFRSPAHVLAAAFMASDATRSTDKAECMHGLLCAGLVSGYLAFCQAAMLCIYLTGAVTSCLAWCA